MVPSVSSSPRQLIGRFAAPRKFQSVAESWVVRIFLVNHPAVPMITRNAIRVRPKGKITLKGQHHEDFAVLGKSCAKIITLRVYS